jgi:tetratricopeptide (TPR) repeat protein
VLPWGLIDNRPFLRCMHGYGLCLWRLGRFDEAEHVFDRILWLNPTDNQGVRFLIEDVRAGRTWEESQGE